ASAPLSAAMRRTAAADASRLRLAITTCRPSRASWRAHSKPIPELPPVTITTSRCIAAPAAVRPLCSGAIRSEPHQHLAEVLALEEPEKRLRRLVDSVEHGLLPLDSAGPDPGGHIGEELGRHVEKVGDDEALHLEALADHIGEVARPGRRLHAVVHADHAAHHHSAVSAHQLERHLEVLAADVLVVDVDAVRARPAD